MRRDKMAPWTMEENSDYSMIIDAGLDKETMLG